MENSILLIGLGRFGTYVARELSKRGHQVLAMDQNEERVNAVLPFVTSAQIGDSTNREFLQTLGVRSFDSCIVAIGDDFQSSLETTYLLHELGAKQIVARAAAEIQEKFLLQSGANEVVFPEKQLAAWTAIRCSSDSILDYLELGDGYSVYEVLVPTAWDGKTIAQIDVRKKYGITILGLKQNGILHLNVPPDTVLSVEASVLVLGQEKAVCKCFRV